MRKGPMKTLLMGFVMFVCVVVSNTPAQAATLVTKEYRTYSSYNYTISVDSAAMVTAYPTQGTPLVSGGCKNLWHKNARNKNIFDGTTCPTPGTVRFASPDFVACETVFGINVDSVVVYNDQLNAPCPPPLPPKVVVSHTETSIVFTNPASIEQSATGELLIDSLDATLVGDGPFTYTTLTRFGGTTTNRTVTFWAIITTTVPAASSVSIGEV